MDVRRPTRQQVEEAQGRTIRDVVGPGLAVLFVGINPSLYSAAAGHHFARPGNRFWKALHQSGFTPRLLSPFEDESLLDYGLGVTNIVERATAAADELTRRELAEGAKRLSKKVCRYSPGHVAILGVTAFRAAFELRRATVGPQQDSICDSKVWVLPNPSGRTAAYQLPALVAAFSELRREAIPPNRRPVRRRGA